jgi:hypothetical protein
MDGRNDLHDTVSGEPAKSRHALLKPIVPRSDDLAIFCRRAEHQVSACVQPEWILGPPSQGVRHCYFERAPFSRENLLVDLTGKWDRHAEEHSQRQ